MEGLEAYPGIVDKLIADSGAKDAAWQLGFDKDVLDERTRMAERGLHIAEETSL